MEPLFEPRLFSEIDLYRHPFWWNLGIGCLTWADTGDVRDPWD